MSKQSSGVTNDVKKSSLGGKGVIRSKAWEVLRFRETSRELQLTRAYTKDYLQGARGHRRGAHTFYRKKKEDVSEPTTWPDESEEKGGALTDNQKTGRRSAEGPRTALPSSRPGRSRRSDIDRWYEGREADDG